jgi:predicted Ser/Thr protein kinase/tetratricopeptide (TPR) repeat protein
VTTIGRYQVKRQLGHGGMGDVFLARDPSLDRDVALKVLHRDSPHGLREEARVLAALRHPGIVTIYEIGEHEGQDFIAMEYVPGRTLRDVIGAGAPRGELLAICAKVATAVAAAHKARILHRDIKPENVIVLDGEVKVVDFGVARRLASGKRLPRAATAQEVADVLTRTLPLGLTPDTIVDAGTVTVFGTPAYMAPEVLFGEDSTPASDVYGLGIVLHECLVKRRPHSATTLVEMIAQIIEGPPPKVDDPLGDLVERMLAREPERRPKLDEVIARLAAPRRTRRWPIAAAALLLAGGGAAAYALTRHEPVAAHEVAATIAVAPISVTMPSYGPEAPIPGAIGDVLARVIGDVSGAKLGGLAAPSNDPGGAATIGASYLVTGSIAEQSATLNGTFDLIAVPAGTKLASVTVEDPQLAHLVDEAAVQLAKQLAPAASLDARPNRVRAEKLYREGQRLLRLGTFTHARAYLEQAVDADPTFADGWYRLALALGWTDATDELERHATAKAYELASGPRKQLIEGMTLFLDGAFGAARDKLKHITVDPADRREQLYYLAEAEYHDGRFEDAFADFKGALEIDHDFRPATVHAWQMAVARRDSEAANFYLAAGGAEHAWIDFALGRYDGLTGQYAAWAELEQGGPLSPGTRAMVDQDDLGGATFRIALASPAQRPALFADAWQRYVIGHEPADFYALEALGEVVVTAGMKPEATQLVAYLAPFPKPRGFPRLSLLAAAVTGDAALLKVPPETYRNERIAAASAAELRGDHDAAAAILEELVASPSFTWDYPERAALLRNLHDKAKAQALCADSLKPAVFRPAYLVLRERCRT